jgi:rhomboid protease GluP
MPEPAVRRERLPTTPVVRGIIVACAVLYVLSLGLDPRAAVRDWSPLGVLSPSTLALYRLGMTSGPAWDYGWWWTVFTATYLHGGILHIAFNMLWARELGTVVERVWGPRRFFLIFSAGGAAGFVLSDFALGAPTIGASGAVFGLIGALIVLGHRRQAYAFRTQMVQTAVVLFAVSFLIPGVNNWGHAGGFVGGLAMAAALPLAEAGPAGSLVLGADVALAFVTLGGVLASFVVTSTMI